MDADVAGCRRNGGHRDLLRDGGGGAKGRAGGHHLLHRAAITAGLTALCYAELASSIPASGSSYSHARAAFGDFVAFVVAACLLLEYALAASATAIGWSGYLNNFLGNALGWSIPETLRSPMLVAGKAGLEVHVGHINLPPVILVVLCAVLLLRGTRESALVNAAMVLLKLLVLVFLR